MQTPIAASSRSISVTENAEPGVRVAALGMIERGMWEGNILFGLGRHEEVRSLAKAAQEKGSQGGYALLLGLKRLEGDKQGFEDLAVEYAVQTGNSPPVWLDLHDRKEIRAAPAHVTLTILALTSETVIEATIKMESPWPIRLDLASASKWDAMGVAIFNESLSGRILREEKTILLNAEPLVARIVTKIKPQAIQDFEPVWQFCFNAMRLMGDRQGFEILAHEFLEKTGELPVWTDLSEREAEDPEPTRTSARPGIKAGDVLSVFTADFARQLAREADYAVARETDDVLTMDLAHIVRWTLADMVGLSAFVKTVAADGVRLELVNINEILLSLMHAFEIERYAKLVVAGGTT